MSCYSDRSHANWRNGTWNGKSDIYKILGFNISSESLSYFGLYGPRISTWIAQGLENLNNTAGIPVQFHVQPKNNTLFPSFIRYPIPVCVRVYIHTHTHTFIYITVKHITKQRILQWSPFSPFVGLWHNQGGPKLNVSSHCFGTFVLSVYHQCFICI